MMLTGSEIICECLIEQGVDTVFGYPGGTILNVYDALYRYQDKINHVLTSHEQGASHAADGYARATGKVGVCMATSGPGATNLVTGIATAYMDSTPLVAITANVGVEILGRDSFQEIDITGVTMPITKHNFIVKDIKDLVPAIRKAFYIAKEGRPGPVLVDVTKNVTAEKMKFESLQPKAIEPKIETYTVEDLDQAIEMIKESEKPFIFAGGGVFFATNPVLTFFMPAGGGLLAGPIYLLLIAKVHKRWSLSIMGVIMGIIWFVTGMHWAFALGYMIMAIVADFVAGAGQYKSKKLNSLSYILFSLGGTGSYIVFFVDPNGWAQTMLGNGTEQSYIDTMQATANTGILIAMFAAVIITSAISAFVGCKMLKKQFEKAGITA